MLGFTALCCGARSISSIDKDGSWYRFYDENGSRYMTVGVSTVGELKGWSASIVIFQNGQVINVYDADMKRLLIGGVSTYGEVISVSGNTFTTKSGSWIYTYDKTGKRLNVRSAH